MTRAATLWLLASIPTFLLGSSLLRVYVGSGRLWLVAAALVVFSAGNLMMIGVMRGSGLGPAIAASAVTQLLSAALIGIVIFGERPPLAQLAGMALGIAAIGLILWPAAR